MMQYKSLIMVMLAFILLVNTFFIFSYAGGSSLETFPLSAQSIRNLSSSALTVHLEKHAIVTNIWIDSFQRIAVLQENDISILIVDIGATGLNGTIETPHEEIVSFLSFISSYEEIYNYSFILLPYSEINTHTYNFSSESFRANVIDDYEEFITLGFDGVFIDVEPIQFSQRNLFLDYLREIDERFGDKIVSIYSGNIGNTNTNEWEWGVGYFHEVSAFVDIVSFPAYDTGFKSQRKYREYIKDQIRIIITENFSTEFLLAVPTHKEKPESIRNALRAYDEGIDKNVQGPFVGTALFAEWTMDYREWRTFQFYTNKKR